MPDQSILTYSLSNLQYMNFCTVKGFADFILILYICCFDRLLRSVPGFWFDGDGYLFL